MIDALGEPTNDTMTSNYELLTFNGETPFWKTGGVGQLLMGKTQIKSLMVIITNGVVSDYTLTQTWVNR